MQLSQGWQKVYQAGAVTAESDQIIRIDKNQDITSYSV